MGYYVVSQGDCLSSIAKTCGFADYQTIYQHPQNAEFRQKRPNPNIICPGDVLFIPEIETKQVSKPTDERHVFQTKAPRVQLRLCLKDDLQQPYKSTRYHLRVGNDHWDGSTDGDGILEQQIPADATEGEVFIYPAGASPEEGYSFTLQLGELDPVEEMSGIDARLINLGFGPLDAEDSLSEESRAEGIKAFQTKFGLEATGELTEETKSKLRELHDGA
ncbi:MAG TPA: peptidoglycan-binding protein [Verrucomicrobiae bacterium]|nr:peptidoglycan-binding protein [Verrucomicrobiae bacterium]